MSLAIEDQQTGNELATARRVTPINEPIDRGNVGAIQLLDSAGGVSFKNMIELMDFAKLMAVSGTAVPKHLRGSPGACLAVCIQAIEWRMSPFAVANKSYSVNDRLAYESAMYHAVASRRAPIKGRVKMEYAGKGDTRTCKVWADLADGTGPVEYTSPEFGKIITKNSPLWKGDPDQQLFYFSVRAWVRRHFPDVMAGIYTVDELQDGGAAAPGEGAPAASSRSVAKRFNAAALPDTQLPEHEIPAYIAPPEPAAADPVSPHTDQSSAGSEPDVTGADAEPAAERVEVTGSRGETTSFPAKLTPAMRKDVKALDDLILHVKPVEMPMAVARAAFKKRFNPHSWNAMTPEDQDHHYMKLLHRFVKWED